MQRASKVEANSVSLRSMEGVTGWVSLFGSGEQGCLRPRLSDGAPRNGHEVLETLKFLELLDSRGRMSTSTEAPTTAPLLTVRQAAERLACSTATVYAL